MPQRVRQHYRMETPAKGVLYTKLISNYSNMNKSVRIQTLKFLLYNTLFLIYFYGITYYLSNLV